MIIDFKNLTFRRLWQSEKFHEEKPERDSSDS